MKIKKIVKTRILLRPQPRTQIEFPKTEKLLVDYITRRGQQNYLVLYAGEPSLTNDELTSIKTVVRDQIFPPKKFSILHHTVL